MKLRDLSAVTSPIRTRLPTSAGRNAPIIFLALLLGAILSNHFIFDDDPYKCQTLARAGSYYEGHWTPSGCELLGYGGHQIDSCAQGQQRKIVFAGDLSLQDIFWSIATRLDPKITPVPLESKDVVITRGHIELEFLWDEWLNGTEVVNRLEDLRDGKETKPMLTVVGGGRTFVEASNVDGYQSAVASLADIAFSSDGQFPVKAPGLSKVFNSKDGTGDLLLFAPAAFTRPERLADGDTLEAYMAADESLASLAAAHPEISVLWSFKKMLDGQEYNRGIPRVQADLLLNLRCNAVNDHFPPNRGICCGLFKRPNLIQMSFLLLGLGALPAIVALDLARPFFSATTRTTVRGFAAFSAAVSLQYLADRTHVFEQVVKFGWQLPFALKMIAVSAVFGVATLRRCKPAGKPAANGKPVDQPFLPREQTDEWKGWMQLAIIIYHYHKGWEALWIWELVRVCVASYLFLTGFGHTLYFLQKKDYSFKRFVNIMIRTNLLPCTLAYVLDTRWVFYYYMPLSSFFYAVTFATLAIGKAYNDRTWFLLAKIAGSAAAVDVFINIKRLPEAVVKLFQITCRLSFDADEFFGFRVGQDRYIVFTGMLAAIAFLWIKDVLASNKRQDFMSRTVRKLFPALKYLTIAICAVTSTVFWWYLQQGHIRIAAEFTEVQPYITFIPILTFMVLRNAHPVLRNWHSAAFAWLGRYSGEMYVMQCHIWLASDTDTVLRSGLFHGDESFGDRWRDLAVITPLYLIACSIIGDATGVIATWFLQDRAPGAGSAATIPTSDVEIGLLSEAGESDEMPEEKVMRKVSFVERLARFTFPWPALHWRVLFVLVVMWALNWAYT